MALLKPSERDRNGVLNREVVCSDTDYRSSGEHVLIFILTFWTFGLGNVLWAPYRYFMSSDKKVVRDEQAAAGQTQSAEPSIVAEEPEASDQPM